MDYDGEASPVSEVCENGSGGRAGVDFKGFISLEEEGGCSRPFRIFVGGGGEALHEIPLLSPWGVAPLRTA